MNRAWVIAAAVLLGSIISRLAVTSSPAQGAPAAAGRGEGEFYVLQTGGAQSNQMDLCWIMAKVRPVGGKERTVLALYRAEKNGDAFDLKAVRWNDPDLQMIEYNSSKPSVKDVLKSLPAAQQNVLNPPAPPQGPVPPGQGAPPQGPQGQASPQGAPPPGGAGGSGTRTPREGEPPTAPK